MKSLLSLWLKLICVSIISHHVALSGLYESDKRARKQLEVLQQLPMLVNTLDGNLQHGINNVYDVLKDSAHDRELIKVQGNIRRISSTLQAMQSAIACFETKSPLYKKTTEKVVLVGGNMYEPQYHCGSRPEIQCIEQQKSKLAQEVFVETREHKSLGQQLQSSFQKLLSVMQNEVFMAEHAIAGIKYQPHLRQEQLNIVIQKLLKISGIRNSLCSAIEHGLQDDNDDVQAVQGAKKLKTTRLKQYSIQKLLEKIRGGSRSLKHAEKQGNVDARKKYVVLTLFDAIRNDAKAKEALSSIANIDIPTIKKQMQEDPKFLESLRILLKPGKDNKVLSYLLPIATRMDGSWIQRFLNADIGQKIIKNLVDIGLHHYGNMVEKALDNDEPSAMLYYIWLFAKCNKEQKILLPQQQNPYVGLVSTLQITSFLQQKELWFGDRFEHVDLHQFCYTPSAYKIWQDYRSTLANFDKINRLEPLSENPGYWQDYHAHKVDMRKISALLATIEEPAINHNYEHYRFIEDCIIAAAKAISLQDNHFAFLASYAGLPAEASAQAGQLSKASANIMQDFKHNFHRILLRVLNKHHYLSLEDDIIRLPTALFHYWIKATMNKVMEQQGLNTAIAVAVADYQRYDEQQKTYHQKINQNCKKAKKSFFGIFARLYYRIKSFFLRRRMNNAKQYKQQAAHMFEQKTRGIYQIFAALYKLDQLNIHTYQVPKNQYVTNHVAMAKIAKLAYVDPLFWYCIAPHERPCNAVK